jgi:hypothetical protein
MQCNLCQFGKPNALGVVDRPVICLRLDAVDVTDSLAEVLDEILWAQAQQGACACFRPFAGMSEPDAYLSEDLPAYRATNEAFRRVIDVAEGHEKSNQEIDT